MNESSGAWVKGYRLMARLVNRGWTKLALYPLRLCLRLCLVKLEPSTPQQQGLCRTLDPKGTKRLILRTGFKMRVLPPSWSSLCLLRNHDSPPSSLFASYVSPSHARKKCKKCLSCLPVNYPGRASPYRHRLYALQSRQGKESRLQLLGLRDYRSGSRCVWVSVGASLCAFGVDS